MFEPRLPKYQWGQRVRALIDLLNAQSALASARFQQVQARYNWHLAKASLASAIGTLDLAALTAGADTVHIDTSRSSIRK